jgi:hypothetical protein
MRQPTPVNVMVAGLEISVGKSSDREHKEFMIVMEMTAFI